MQKLLLLSFLVLSILGISCNKSSSSKCSFTESPLVASAGEIAAVQTYLTATSTTAIQHSSGIFYQIVNPGTGATPAVCSTVTVKYRGRLTSGATFDENTTGARFVLGQLIVGWQKGIPLIKKGGSINLYIPPSLGHGSSAAGSIPANSILIFSIELLDVQ
ncbi:MAG: FKBP-type peptidyl-prolyl cis-trans isomerase [Ferruginibacter sp.]